MMASQEQEAVFQLLVQTLSADQNTRQSAEQQLASAGNSSGFASLMLSIATGPLEANATTNGARTAAAVYFKNMILKRYNAIAEAGNENGQQPGAISESDIQEAERAHLRQAILPAVISSSAVARKMLITAFGKMVRVDYPKRWPDLIQQVASALHSSAQSSTSNSEAMDQLIALLSVTRTFFAWQGGYNNDQERFQVQNQFFPTCLAIMHSHLNSAMASLDERALLAVRLVLKTFYSTIQFNFSAPLLLDQSAFQQWMEAITSVVMAPATASIASLDAEDASQHAFWKAKKWALRIHNKIFARYGCSKLESYRNPDFPQFAKLYMSQVAVPVLQVFVNQASSMVSGQNPMPDVCFVLICDYLENAIRPSKTWNVLKSSLSMLIEQFLFPRFCFDESDQELWEDSPSEYVRTRLDPFDDMGTPIGSAITFVTDAVRHRKKVSLPHIVGFLSRLLSPENAAVEQQSPQQIDGALNLLGRLATLLCRDKNMKHQISGVLSAFVVPRFTSATSFLRMRACWVVSEFELTELDSQLIVSILQGVIPLLVDGNQPIPVRVAASFAFGTLLDHPDVAMAIAQASDPSPLPRIVESCLQLANDVQIDSLGFVLERLISTFAEQIAPYSVQLCASLCATVTRQLEGYRNVIDFEDEGDEQSNNIDYGRETEKLMAVIGILDNIRTLLEHMAKSPEIMEHMEGSIVPLVAAILQKRLTDMFDETFDIINSVLFNRKTVSPAMWELFPILCRLFESDGLNYFAEMETVFDNYISFGVGRMVSSTELFQGLMSVFHQFQDNNCFDDEERLHQCRLSVCLLLSIKFSLNSTVQVVDSVLPTMMNYALRVICNENFNNFDGEATLSTFAAVSNLEVILAAIYYNGPLALSHLESSNALAPFFTSLGNYRSKFTRVNDMRLLTASIGTLLDMHNAGVALPSVLVDSMGTFLLPVYLTAVTALPHAIAERQRLEKEEEEYGSSDYDASEWEDSQQAYDDDEAEDDDEEAEEGNLRRSKSQAHDSDDYEYGGDDDDDEYAYDGEELEEELFFESPLDKLDLNGNVKSVVHQLHERNPQMLNDAVSQLSPEHSQVLQTLLSA